MAFTDPGLDPRGAGYNTTQARIAIGNGGLFGQGLFDGSQTRSRFVPEQHTDFIFTVAGEELGLIGAGVLILLFAVLLWRALHISLHADDMFGRVAAAGIACWFAFQTFQNIGMCLGIMPVTGVPLPLVSYGGSSMFASMMAVGLLQNIAMRGSAASRPDPGVLGLGQGEAEGRAALGVAPGRQLPAVQRHDAPGECQAQAGAGGTALDRASVELLEDQLLLTLGTPMPWSVTSTRTHPGSTSRAEVSCTQGAWSGAVYLIAFSDEVVQQLAQQAGVGLHAVREVEHEAGLVAVGPAGPAALHDLRGDLGQLHGVGRSWPFWTTV